MKACPTRSRRGWPPFAGDFFFDDPTGAEVVDDGGAWVLFGGTVSGEQGGGDVAADGLAFFIDDDKSVGVAVEADTQVGLSCRGRFCLSWVRLALDEWIGVVIERAVMGEVESR